jgi:hypothetical protein
MHGVRRAGETRGVRMVGSGPLRWAALAALAALAGAEFAAQYLAAAPHIAAWLRLPPAAVHFLTARAPATRHFWFTTGLGAEREGTLGLCRPCFATQLTPLLASCMLSRRPSLRFAQQPTLLKKQVEYAGSKVSGQIVTCILSPVNGRSGTNAVFPESALGTAGTHKLPTCAAPQDVVGIDCGLRGWRLALRLLAPGSLLAALRLYSFGFVLGALRVCHL